jgi:hypothetical protein
MPEIFHQIVSLPGWIWRQFKKNPVVGIALASIPAAVIWWFFFRRKK